MSDQDGGDATALVAHAIGWGLLLTLAKKKVIDKQEVMDSLDIGLHWLETLQDQFSNPSAVEDARKIIEQKMNAFRAQMP
jgi:hypothetical protein